MNENEEQEQPVEPQSESELGADATAENLNPEYAQMVGRFQTWAARRLMDDGLPAESNPELQKFFEQEAANARVYEDWTGGFERAVAKFKAAQPKPVNWETASDDAVNKELDRRREASVKRQSNLAQWRESKPESVGAPEKKDWSKASDAEVLLELEARKARRYRYR